MADENNRALTFGEKMVGLTFNPSGDANVEAVKRAFATALDIIHELEVAAPTPAAKELYAVAITDTLSAQMFAVKAITWKY